MHVTTEQYFTHEDLAPGIHAFRFIKPDLRKQLDPIVGNDNVLFRAIVEAMDDLRPGDRVIFNFGLVEWFTTAFFHLMIRVRKVVDGKQQILLCSFRPEFLTAVELMGGSRLFQITSTEEAAIIKARANHAFFLPR